MSGMISYIQNVLRRCLKISMDGADMTRGGEAIQEHECAADLSDTLALVPKCPKDTSAPTQKSKTFRYQRYSAELS